MICDLFFPQIKSLFNNNMDRTAKNNIYIFFMLHYSNHLHLEVTTKINFGAAARRGSGEIFLELRAGINMLVTH